MGRKGQCLGMAEGKTLTFSEVSDPLAIHGRAVLIHVGHEELAEMADDRPTDALVCNPFDNRLGLDVAQLLERYFLLPA